MGMCGYSWNIPSNLVLTEVDYGMLRANLSLDTGPFGGTIKGSKDLKLHK